MPVSPHTLDRQCAPHAGLTYQGRYDENPSANRGMQSISDGARQADPPTPEREAELARLMQNAYQPAECSDIGDNAEDCEPATWWQDTLFVLACAVETVALACAVIVALAAVWKGA